MAEGERTRWAGFGRAIAATCGFVLGAVFAPFVGNYAPILAKPLSLAGVQPLHIGLSWADACDAALLAESQIKAGQSGSPDGSAKFMQGQGIFQQDVLTLKMRTRFTDVVIIEGWNVQTRVSKQRPAWVMQSYVDGCGGGC